MRTATRLCSAFALTSLLSALPAVADAPVIDGDTSDWPAGTSVWSDGDDIRIRFTIPRAESLQNSHRTAALRIDADGDAGTGEAFGAAEGVDLSVIFSPEYRGEVGNGLSVRASVGGRTTVLDPSGVGLVYAPSHASRSFEVRLDRSFENAGETVRLDGAGTLRWWLTPLDLAGNATGVWDTGSGVITAGGAPELGSATLPEKPAGGVRVASMNVLWASPFLRPEPFARLMNAIDADIWLFQEWDIRERDQPRLPTDATAEWLGSRLEGDDEWAVFAGEERGVVIASRLPIEPVGPVGVKAAIVGDRRAMIERSVRHVSAVAETPAGRLLLACLHLKCCGGKGGEEDRQRIAESIAVSEALHTALGATGAAGVVVGGDFNLVGSPEPLAILKNGLDPTGADLVHSDARVLGDDVIYTWTEAGSRFPAGRLDYMLTSPSSLRVVGEWILDTARLDDESLSAMGLMRGDSAATDHRPLIVDLMPAK